jgi:N-acetyl-gamma-glutamyl-phosphate reductase
MKTVKTGIIGGAGYTGGELIRILLQHPMAEIGFIQSTSNAGNLVSDVHRDLTGDTMLKFTEGFNDADIDVLFLCSGHGQSTAFFQKNPVKDGLRIIDLSQDFRIQSPDHFRKFTYGLCESNRREISSALNIANPGCFATAIQLGLWPLAQSGNLTDEIHVSAITGSTGAGQSLSSTSHFSWRNNNVSVYKAFGHQHLLEIHQSLRGWQPDFNQQINFIPFRGNFTRGILATTYLRSSLSAAEARTIFDKAYDQSPFVHISNKNIDLKQVVGTNKCLVYIEKHDDKLMIISAIDNLLKGASGQAVQNMNIMFGLQEDAGLQLKSIAF